MICPRCTKPLPSDPEDGGIHTCTQRNKTVSALREDHGPDCHKQVGWSMPCNCGFDDKLRGLHEVARKYQS